MASTLDYGIANRQQYARYYRHTGKASFLGVAVPLVVGSLLAIGLGWLNVFAMHWVDYIFLVPLIPFLFGGIVGLLMALMVHVGHVRGRLLTSTLLLLVTFVGYYAAWYWHLYRQVGPTMTPSFANFVSLGRPDIMRSLMQFFSDEGTWFIGRGSTRPIRGTIVWVSWLLELIAYFGMAFLAARFALEKRIYCEQCADWCEPAEPLMRVRTDDRETATSRLEQLDAGYIRDLADGPDPDHYWSLQCEACSKCEAFATLSLIDVRVRYNSTGNASVKRKPIVNRLVVEGDQLKHFLASILPDETPDDTAADGDVSRETRLSNEQILEQSGEKEA